MNRKRVCDFLLIRYRNLGPMLHRFWDTVTYWLKIAYFSYPSPSHSATSLAMFHWNFVKLTMKKLDSWRYSPARIRSALL